MIHASNDPVSPTQNPAPAIVTSVAQINAFNWLLVLGFPPEVAAAAASPETFTR